MPQNPNKRRASEAADAHRSAVRVKPEPHQAEAILLPAPVLRDEADYQNLRRHYFDRVVVRNVELPGGRVLREQSRPPRIEQTTPGFVKLRARVRALEKVGDHDEVYRLLRQLREWERRPPSLGGALPACMRSEAGGASNDDVCEVIVIADNDQIIDADQFVLEVLLARQAPWQLYRRG